jgi:ribosome biogenesis protein Tsr3
MTEDEKREAAAYLGENVLWLIEQILIKHNIAIIEASKEAIDAAVKKEREECAKICEIIDSSQDYYGDRIELVCAEAIRARG